MIISNLPNTIWLYQEHVNGCVWIYAEEPKYSEHFAEYISSAVIGFVTNDKLEGLGVDAKAVREKPQPVEVNIKIETLQ